ncbi:MAG TPA: GNAT family N-acetyltransferase [Terriglobales bacterium]
MQFSDLALARRLEGAEGSACVEFAAARGRLFPESGAQWMRHAGVYVAFDGVESPITQTFGLGMFEELKADALDVIERFFLDRGAPVFHEVSPFAGVEAQQLLCARGYRPIELSSVMYRPVERELGDGDEAIRVRVVGPNEAQKWAEVSAQGWSHEHPELRDFMRDLGVISAAREGSVSFLAEIDGEPGASGALSLHQGVALFGGAATVPELRRRGLQGALLQERMRYAFEHGCDLAMMVALPGSESQRNAERKGFRIAYTRTKWELGGGEKTLTTEAQRHGDEAVTRR